MPQAATRQEPVRTHSRVRRRARRERGATLPIVVWLIGVGGVDEILWLLLSTVGSD